MLERRWIDKALQQLNVEPEEYFRRGRPSERKKLVIELATRFQNGTKIDEKKFQPFAGKKIEIEIQKVEYVQKPMKPLHSIENLKIDINDTSFVPEFLKKSWR